jgi:chorismate mutase
MQGLMIESHIDPSVAWTDAKQQLTPQALTDLMDFLTLRKPESRDKEFADKLADLRSHIDKLDDQIIQKMAERMQIVEKIGEFKRDNGVTILQVSRWDEIMHKRSAFAQALKLDLNFTGKLLELIHGESIRKQTQIMNTKSVVEK